MFESYKCSICKEIKQRLFISKPVNGNPKYIDSSGRVVKGKKCLDCDKALRKQYLKKTKNAPYRRYEKTKNGFLMRIYRNMKSRCKGIVKPHLYKGKSILPKEEFYDWALSSPEFHSLFRVWEKAGYDQKLTPSVNRIDSSNGYILNNIEWVTHSRNSSLGGKWSSLRAVSSTKTL